MKRFFITVCLAGLALVSIHSAKIPLKGDLPGNGSMTPVTIPAVEANQYSGYIDIIFNVGLGSLNVAVVDAAGNIVFQSPVVGVAGSAMSIDTANFAAGEYILFIVNQQGEFLTGNFGIS